MATKFSKDGLAITDKFHDTILDSLSEGVYLVDLQRRILYWNKACEQLSGYKGSEVVGTCCANGVLRHCDEKGNNLCNNGCPLTAAMKHGKNQCAHVFLHHVDGHRVPVHVRSAPIRDTLGSIIGAVEIFSDDTEQIGVLDRLTYLEQSALIDELTGLANRRYFNRKIKACLSDFHRNGNKFGLTMIDIDHFKQVNDIHGHDVGDAVLKMVAATLIKSCRPEDTPIRWGGEEFAIISKLDDEEALHTAAERLRVMIHKSSYPDGAKSIDVSVSMGISMVRFDDDKYSLLKRVDTNLFKSKDGGRNRITMDNFDTSHTDCNAA